MKNRAELYGYADGSAFKGMSTAQVFEQIARDNRWKDTQSISGHGSSLAQTRKLVAELPAIFEQLGVKQLLDLPCGDFNWMSEVLFQCSFLTTVEADISTTALRAAQAQSYDPKQTSFVALDLLFDDLPPADLLFCRDCLVHLSFADIEKAIENAKAANITYLMTTTFPDEPQNLDIITGGWRPLNFQQPPFNWPAPQLLLNEGCTECDGAFADKSLGVWRLGV